MAGQAAANRIPQNSYQLGKLTGAWREFSSKEGWTQSMAFGPNMTRASYVIAIPWANLENAVWQITGYPNVGGGGGISRSLPIQHPGLYWLWARNIVSVKGGPFPTSLGASNVDSAKVSNYDYAYLTVEFWAPPYSIADNVANEWERYVEWQIEPAGEFMTRQMGAFKFIDGGPQNGRNVIGQRSMYLPKKRIKAIWYQVPELGLFPGLTLGQANFNSPNLDLGIGTVNDVTWAGNVAQTILAESWGASPEVLGVNPAQMAGGVDIGFHTARCWTVFINFLHFDPNPGNAAVRGHNLLPQTDNKWWLIQATGGANKPYPTYNDRTGKTFSTLWKMN